MSNTDAAGLRSALILCRPFYRRAERAILADPEREALPEKINILRRAVERSADALGADPAESFWLARALAVRAVRRDLERLAEHPLVARVAPETPAAVPRPCRTIAAPGASRAVSWGVRRIAAEKLWKLGLRGRGVLIGHIDTGIDAEHPALAGKLESFEAFDAWGRALTGTPAHDSESHGTNTAGVLVGGGGIGVAPGARLCSALALPNGAGSVRQILAALEWALERGARVLNFSLGGAGYDPVYEPVLRNLRLLGALSFAAVGNEGLGVTGSPANLAEACAVGAIDSEDRVAAFSGGGAFVWGENNVSIKPDLVAPGVAVRTALPLAEARAAGVEPYELLDGASLAAPHAAGAAALLWEACPEAEADQVLEALYSSCVRIGADFHNMHSGRGLLYAPAALAKLEKARRTAPLRV